MGVDELGDTTACNKAVQRHKKHRILKISYDPLSLQHYFRKSIKIAYFLIDEGLLRKNILDNIVNAECTL